MRAYASVSAIIMLMFIMMLMLLMVLVLMLIIMLVLMLIIMLMFRIFLYAYASTIQAIDNYAFYVLDNSVKYTYDIYKKKNTEFFCSVPTLIISIKKH